MNICLVSWDTESKLLYELLKEKYEVSYVIERDHNLWGKNEFGLTVISFSRAYDFFKKKKIDSFLIPCMRGINVKIGIYDRLIKNNIPSNNILYAPLRIFKDSQITKKEKIDLICKFEDRTELDYVALHITDHCNLNCAYCSVFCGLISKPSFTDFDKTKNALRLLKSYFEQIVVFRVLGGEPTLNPCWLDYCLMIKELFPLTDVEVVTNGTKILSMKDEQFKIMHDKNIAFDISYYSILSDKIDDINEILNNKKIIHYITQENEFFSRLYDFNNTRDEKENYESCKMKFMCLNMREYYLGACHAAFGLERAKEYLINIDISDNYKMDLRQSNLSAKEIISKLDKSTKLCRYCNQDLTRWHIISKGANKNIKEWSL